MKRVWCWLCFTIVFALACSARADVRRMAVVVGSNAGGAERVALRYAETDAEKIASVLVELGDFRRSDVYLLRGRPIGTIRDVLVAAHEKIVLWRRDSPSLRVVLVFYFSGHSDGESLELGADQLGFAELRRWLADSGADVRLAIIDSCKSGSVLAAKGGTRGGGFEINLTDTLASSGEAILTSSAATEAALESEELRGSFFSHSLVSGLRGAADSNQDGHVTLAEAYEHAFARTLAATSNTVYGPQHPGYAYRLSGQGDLVLTDFAHPAAALEMPRGFSRILITNVAEDQVVAEVGPSAPRRISVPPGTYGVRGWRERDAFGGVFSVAQGQMRSISADELTPQSLDSGRAKGGDRNRDDGADAAATAWSPGWGLDGSLGGVSWASGHGTPLLLGARLSGQPQSASGPTVALEALTSIGSASSTSGRESMATIAAGYRLGRRIPMGRFLFYSYVGLEAGGGIASQSAAGGSVGVVARAGPTAGLELRLERSRFHVPLLVGLPIYLARSAEELAVRWGPSGFVGVGLDL